MTKPAAYPAEPAALFEHFYCYQYTGEYGILSYYEPYRVFPSMDANGEAKAGGGVNYCKDQLSSSSPGMAASS